MLLSTIMRTNSLNFTVTARRRFFRAFDPSRRAHPPQPGADIVGPFSQIRDSAPYLEELYAHVAAQEGVSTGDDDALS